MAANHTKNSAERNLIVYFVLLVFACVCMSILISQRLQIARCGRGISSLDEEAARLRSTGCRLRFHVAEQASYRNLLARAARMRIQLVPPEEAVAADLAARRRQERPP